MKLRKLYLISSMLFSVAIFAQKDEIKAAEKLLKEGNSQEAMAKLLQAESLLASADVPQKALFYLLKGNASFDLAKKKVDESKNLVAASKAYSDLVAFEKESKKIKYTAQAEIYMQDVKRQLTNSAIADNNEKRYKESAQKLYEVYLLDKKDSVMLYYAAGTAINAKDNDLALKYYTKLKEINYSGKGVNYYAKNLVNDQEDNFASMSDRDKAVRIGTHSKPRTEQVTSKRGEINKNITYIYIEKGDIPAAKKSIAEARKTNPEDNSLVITEAELYLKTEDYDTYKKLMTEVIAKNPRDADLFYNLAVVSGKAKDGAADAEKYYLKAIEIDPQYKNAYMNLAVLKLDGESKIVEQMNKLGTSPADNKKYEALKAKRQGMYKAAVPYLEKAYELFGGDKDVKATLLNVYNALDMTDKYKALKAKN
jgi:Tfp pilus assembly protein PilF